MHSTAVYDFAAEVLRGRHPGALVRAYAAPLQVWRRVLGFEGCAVQVDHALTNLGIAHSVPDELRLMLREETSRALRHGLFVHRQLPAIAAVAAANGIRVMALKGAARLLAGERAGMRSLADIDLLARPEDASRLHTLLQQELGYLPEAKGAMHHLPGLTKPGHLGIEIHHRLSPDTTSLDATIWRESRSIKVGSHTIEVPSPTAMLTHTLEHAIGVNWMGRYRLRDIVDAATLCSAEVSLADLNGYVESSPSRAALETLLSAAHEHEQTAPLTRPRAWRTIRRVARPRVALAVHARAPGVAERWYRYTGILAEGSPRTIWRAGSELVARRLGRVAVTAS